MISIEIEKFYILLFFGVFFVTCETEWNGMITITSKVKLLQMKKPNEMKTNIQDKEKMIKVWID